MNDSNLRPIKCAGGFRPGAGRPKDKTVKTISEFKAAHVKDIKKFWEDFETLYNSPVATIQDKINIRKFQIEWIGGKAIQGLANSDGTPITFQQINFTPQKPAVNIPQEISK